MPNYILENMKTGLIPNPTQKERILRRLRVAGNKGVMVWELTTPRPLGGEGCMQYGARILELRREGFVIDNVEPGHFVLKFDPERSKDGQLPMFTGETVLNTQ